MMKKLFLKAYFIFIVLFMFCGCAKVSQTSKTVLGAVKETPHAIWDFSTEKVPEAAKGLGRFSLKAAQPKSWIEVTKVLWGSSTRALEEVRGEAISQSYPCRFEECFDAIVGLGRGFRPPQTQSIETVFSSMGEGMGQTDTEAETAEPSESSEDQNIEEPVTSSQDSYYVFIQSRIKKYIVVMDIPGTINTTEVGIFFSNPDEQTTHVEIASLSPLAKEKIAALVFHQLETLFPLQDTDSLPK